MRYKEKILKPVIYKEAEAYKNKKDICWKSKGNRNEVTGDDDI